MPDKSGLSYTNEKNRNSVSMNTDDFAKGLKSSIIDDGMKIYADLFIQAEANSVTDPYFNRALGFYNSLSDEQKSILLEMIRQTSIDAISAFCGVLDGTSSIGNQFHTFVLHDQSGNKLNGDLQDYFLAEFEE